MAKPFWSTLTACLGRDLPLPTRASYRCTAITQDPTWLRPVQWSAGSAVGRATSDLLRAVVDNSVQESDMNASLATQANPKKAKLSKGGVAVPVGRTTKIRLYPTAKQRAVLQEWFGAARWTYNQCVDAIGNKKVVKRDKKLLRAYCVSQEAPQVKVHPWVLDTPQCIRDEALRDLLKAYTTAFALRKTQKQTTPFVMKFRSLKAPSQSIVIHHRDWKDTSKIFLPFAFKKRGAETTLRTSEALPTIVDYDCRLQRTRLGHYYFCLLQPARGSENQAPPDPFAAPRILAIDPGERTFLTGYNPYDGSYVEWGSGDMKRLERLADHLDDLVSRTDKETSSRRRYKMRKAQMRMRLRIRNLVDEFHKKLVHWLVHSYDLVLLPTYETSKMVKKTGRRIGRTTARAILTWSHYRFKQRLLMKTKMEHGKCHVVIINEHYTTMTCGECGGLNHHVGGSKIFECPRCQTMLPRDWNAARNIFLRFVSTSTWATSLPGLGLGPARS